MEYGKEWELLVEQHFDFLSDFGFRLDHVDEKWWATSAVYLSDLLGIEVTRSMEFGRVEVTLLRLVDGKSPDVEVWLREHPLDRVLFDNVLEARAPELLGDFLVALQMKKWRSSFVVTASSSARSCLISSRAAILPSAKAKPSLGSGPRPTRKS